MISLMCLLCVLCQPNVAAFLLQPDHSSSSNASRKNFLSVQEFMAEKRELKHRIEQLEHENEQTLDILTKQLQDKFSILEDKIKDTVKQNKTQEKSDIFEIKFRDLEQNYTFLKQAHEVLQQRFSLQESEITTLSNKSVELEKKISVIEQLKTINQSMDLHNVQNDILQLKQSTSLLKSNQNARNQDFLALYNMTIMSDRNLQEQFENHQNLTNKKVFSKITNNSKLMENQLDMLTHKLNASLTNVFSKMNMLSSQIGENSKKVALTACTVADKDINGAVTFPKIYTSIGITNQAAFQSTGKFVCDVPGLYYISSYIRTQTAGFGYYLMKNNVAISKSATTSWPVSNGYSTSVITAAVDVQRNDELYLKTSNSYRIQYGYSCITVIKVK